MTILDYLEDTYKFKSEATFLELCETEKGQAVILDHTIFYPQGGGQPADHGTIISTNNIFTVTDVRLDETGTVLHFGTFQKESFSKENKVTLEVDEKRRLLNARLHSAGHLLDVAVDNVGIQGLTPTKGYHFTEGPYVEYEGILENAAEWIPKLENEVNKLIDANLKIEKESLTYDQAKSRGIFAPAGKSVQVINFEGAKGCGCGGTHIKSTKEIGRISIRKIKSKKGITKISYSLE